jgi:hypothetical protein
MDYGPFSRQLKVDLVLDVDKSSVVQRLLHDLMKVSRIRDKPDFLLPRFGSSWLFIERSASDRIDWKVGCLIAKCNLHFGYHKTL